MPAPTQPDQTARASTLPADTPIVAPLAESLAALLARRWWAVVALAALIAPLAWPIVRPIAATQTVEVTLADVRAGTGGVLATVDGVEHRLVNRGRHEQIVESLTIRGFAEGMSLSGETARGTVEGVRITTSVFGIDGGTRSAGAIEPAAFEPGAPARLAWRAWGDLIGVLTLGAFGLTVTLVAVGACAVAVRGMDATFGLRIAFAAVALVHGWMWLVSPFLYTKDGVAYLDIAQNVWAGGGLGALEPIRPAGISLLLAPMTALDLPHRWTIGTLNLVLVLAIVWCVARIARRALGPALAALAVLVVGLDPSLIGFARTPGTEIPAAAAAIAACAIVAGRAWGVSLARDVVAALALGLACGAAALVRANLQVLLVLLPVGAAYLTLARVWSRGGNLAGLVRGNLAGSLVAAVALGVGVGCVLPVVLHNGRTHGGYALSLFGNTTQMTSLLQAGVIEPQDTGAIDAEAFAEVRDGLAGNSIAYRYRMIELAGAGDAGSAPMGDVERVAGEIVERAWERDPGGVARAIGGAMAVQLGLVRAERLMRTNHSWTVLRPLAGEPWRGSRTNFMDADRAAARLGAEVVERNTQNTRAFRRTPTALAYASLWSGWAIVRPVVGLVSLVGAVCLLVRGREGMAFVVAVALAHALALAVIAYTPIERYQLPVWPVVVIAACAVLAPRTPRP